MGKKRDNMGIKYDGSKFNSVEEALQPVCYVDSDHKKTGDFRSRSGQVIYMCGAPIYWRSQLQKVIATSSTQAEVIACSDVCKRVCWIRNLMDELGFPLQPVKVWEDNQACLSLIQGQAVTDRSRHIDIRAWWTRELKGKGIIDFDYIKSAENKADFFTKTLGVNEQAHHIASLCSSK